MTVASYNMFVPFRFTELSTSLLLGIEQESDIHVLFRKYYSYSSVRVLQIARTSGPRAGPSQPASLFRLSIDQGLKKRSIN